MATTFKPVVYAHQKRRDGSYNVKIRVTHNRVSRNLATNVTVTAAQLTKGLKVKDALVNDALAETVRQMRKAVTEIGFAAVSMPVDELVAEIRRRLEAAERFELDFYSYGMQHAAGRKPGTRLTYEGAFKQAAAYAGGRLDVGDITGRWLRGYLEHLEREGVSPATARLYLSKLSHVYKIAKAEFNDEDRGIVRIPGDPFTVVKAPAAPEAPKHRNLDRETVQRIIDLRPEERANSRRNLARDMWLLSFCLQGMNLADLWDAVEGPAGYVTFIRRKTGDTRPVELVVRIEPEARRLLLDYSAGGELLGRLRSQYANYKSFYTMVARGMAGVSAAVGCKVDLYSARHTWATLARNDCEVDKWTVHEALSHADRSTRIDDVYLAPDYRRFWEANWAVIHLFRWS